jgi:hypothetical protein
MANLQYYNEYTSVESSVGNHEERLLRDLGFADGSYLPYARPAKVESESVEVEFGLSLQQIIDVVREP